MILKKKEIKKQFRTNWSLSTVIITTCKNTIDPYMKYIEIILTDIVSFALIVLYRDNS